MNLTKLQYRLEKACKETEGRVNYDKNNNVVTCSLPSLAGINRVSIDNKDIVEFESNNSWSRFTAIDVLNIFKKGIPKSGQGIHIKGRYMYGEIGRNTWHVSELW